jgi:hypothetical protein
MLLLETLAAQIINQRIEAKLEDRIQAYQFLSDNWMLGELTGHQQAEFQHYVESGLIATAPWRGR